MARFRQTALVHGSFARGKLQRAGYKLVGDDETYSPRLYMVSGPDGTQLADRVSYYEAIKIARTHQNAQRKAQLCPKT